MVYKKVYVLPVMDSISKETHTSETTKMEIWMKLKEAMN